MADAFIGIDLGGTNLRFGLVDENARIIARRRYGTGAQDGVQAVVERLMEGILALSEKASGLGMKVKGAGVGLPGIIDGQGVVRVSPNLSGWQDIPLRQMLSSALPFPVFVENDANAHALGEAWFGAGKDIKSAVCLTLGTGVGGGIILNGKIWAGADGMAGEVGHVTVEPDGRPCPCGNRGCLERYASATAVVEITAEALRAGARSSLGKLYRNDPAALTPEAIADAAEAGDALASRVYAQAGRYLGIASAGLINLLNVERLIIGGGLANAWRLFIGPLREEAAARAFAIPFKRCRIVRAKLKDDAGILGAAGLALKA